MIEPFPPTENALKDPNGLLAVGGDLSAERLLHAYQRGIFPWYEEGEPILWWTPDPRAVLFPDELHVSRSLRRFLSKCNWEISVNRCFDEVVSACADLTRKVLKYSMAMSSLVASTASCLGGYSLASPCSRGAPMHRRWHFTTFAQKRPSLTWSS
jgi:hypothetical protein